jgi:hypothetical protein
MNIDFFLKLNKVSYMIFFFSIFSATTPVFLKLVHNPWLCQKEFVDPIMYPRP